VWTWLNPGNGPPVKIDVIGVGRVTFDGISVTNRGHAAISEQDHLGSREVVVKRVNGATVDEEFGHTGGGAGRA